jgi:hypothetical protein
MVRFKFADLCFPLSVALTVLAASVGVAVLGALPVQTTSTHTTTNILMIKL